jgi:prepilin-type processing-associated H-X9-DG protein
MIPLNNDQKQLIFDYCLGLTSKEHTAEAKALISSHQEAADIHSRIKANLLPLESIKLETCPDDLVERTISYVNEHVDSSQHQLQQLLEAEQTKKVPIKIGFWSNLTETAAIAASIMLIVGILVPTMGLARQKYWQKKCAVQLGNFFQGLNNYISDHDGRQPSVETAAGAPWWKVGYQGQENQSNTRKVYLLVLNNYISPGEFICPSNKVSRNLQIESSKVRTYRDFPDRRYVTYSFQINCNKTQSGKLQCRKPIMADLNPLFEKLPTYDSQFRVRLDKRLLTINSSNHNGRGQNVLFGDGRVEFQKTRYTGITQDDIFTLQDTDIYRGVEVPSCETDFFLAP